MAVKGACFAGAPVRRVAEVGADRSDVLDGSEVSGAKKQLL